MKAIIIAILIAFLLLIITFIYCACKLSSIIDNKVELFKDK